MKFVSDSTAYPHGKVNKNQNYNNVQNLNSEGLLILPGDLHAVFVGVFVLTATQLIRQLGHLYAENIKTSSTYSFLK